MVGGADRPLPANLLSGTLVRSLVPVRASVRLWRTLLQVGAVAQ
jgi:hypothetical protein